MNWRMALLLLGMTLRLEAAPVIFKSVQATFHGDTPEALLKAIDGLEASPDGWCVAPRFEQAQAAIFLPEKPIEADLLNLTLFFMSGRPSASFACFSISYTTDAKPGFEGKWHDLPMLNFGTTAANLQRGQDNRLMAEEASVKITGKIPDNLYWITARTRGKSITGLRIDVFPVFRSPGFKIDYVGPGPLMAWSRESDFVLTEFRAEILTTTTNVALGAPVTATHPLYSLHDTMTPDALTDGWPSTIAHPEEDQSAGDFYFEIDLGKQRVIDHLTLRQRGDPYNLERFGKMRIRLYDEDPKKSAAPTWQALNRADGSYPAIGEADVLRVEDGKGAFRGRYLRISTENTVPGSPMLAEVEVYETRTPRLVSVKADDVDLASENGIQVPPGVMRIGFQLEIPQSGKPRGSLYRWRLKEINEDWQSSDSLLLEIPCPTAGNFTLEAQAAHSDGEWDASLLAIPMTVRERFTRSQTFFWLMAGSALAAGGGVASGISRGRISKLKAQAALAAERTRIARDMHDDVGARLSQLSFMLKSLRSDASLPASARKEVDYITAAASETLGSLDEVVWTVNPRNDQLEALCRHLCSHATRYFAPLGIACQIESEPSWPDRWISAHDRHQVTMAFKEALQNVIKHSGANVVKVTLAMENGFFLIRVSDNGSGLPEYPEKSDRIGLENMKSRLLSIGGKCEIHPTLAGGTEVEMRFPTQ
jgi:signal transduction histidine kinase